MSNNSIIIDKNYVQNNISIILVLIVIFVSDDTITFGSAISNTTLIFKLLIYLTALLYLASRYLKQLYYPKYSGWLYCCVGMVLLTALVNFDFRAGYIYQIIIIIFAFFITRAVSIEKFILSFCKLIFYLSIFSIILFVVANLFGSLLDIFPAVENSAGVQVTNLYLGSLVRRASDIRNAGIFREPGVFVVYILICVMVELYYKNKINYYVIVVLIIALLTSYSTTGYFTAGLVFTGYFIFDKKSNVSKIPILILLIFIVLILVLDPYVLERVFSKFSEDSVSYGSTIARIASVFVNYDIFLKYPLFGSGYTNFEELFEYFSFIRYSIPLTASGQSTNTFMGILAMHGIFLFSILIYSVYRLSQFMSANKPLQFITFAVLLFLFSGEEMRMSLMFNVWVMYGITSEKPIK